MLCAVKIPVISTGSALVTGVTNIRVPIMAFARRRRVFPADFCTVFTFAPGTIVEASGFRAQATFIANGCVFTVVLVDVAAFDK